MFPSTAETDVSHQQLAKAALSALFETARAVRLYDWKVVDVTILTPGLTSVDGRHQFDVIRSALSTGHMAKLLKRRLDGEIRHAVESDKLGKIVVRITIQLFVPPINRIEL